MVTAQQLADLNTSERVTSFLCQDVVLPHNAGVMALVTLDNGFDHTKPSTLGPNGLLQAKTVFEECQRRAAAGDIQAVGVTGKPFIFAAGADLSDVGQLKTAAEARAIATLGHDALRLLGEMNVPTFCFINGAILGGGLEIALNCDYRTSTPGIAAAALPECFLGLVPGWGGAYLLPRLIGVEKAFKVILENPLSNNVMLKGPQLRELGISDVSFDSLNFLEESITWAASVISGDVNVDRPTVDLTDAATWEFVCDFARGLLDQRVGGPDIAPAPYEAVELVRAARTAERDAAFAAEDDALERLIVSNQFRAGVYAFNLVQYRAKKPAGAPNKDLARDVTKVGIVGAGLMASQLAVLFVRRMQVPVVLTDVNPDRVASGVDYVHQEFEKLAAKGRLSPDALARYKALVTGNTTKDDFADADFVIEAVFEDLTVKKEVFAQVEAIVTPDCILATNTSSLSVSAMAADLKHPERVVGFHFFNPVAIMPLLEVIRADNTDDATLATAFAVAKKLRKTAVGAKDSTSFIVNRLLGRFMGEVSKIVEEGTDVATVDSAFVGLAPMPPFELLGLVGPAIALHNSESLHAAFGDRFHVSTNLQRMVQANQTSFYLDQDGQKVIAPQVQELLEVPNEPVNLTSTQVSDQVLRALAHEARLMLDEQVVAEPQDIDLAMITGAGFSFWNGGLLPLLDRTGVAEEVTGKRFLAPGIASVG